MLDRRKDAALELLDKWIKEYGEIIRSDRAHELQSIVKDAVEIGMYGRVLGDEPSPEWKPSTCDKCMQFKTCEQAEPGKDADACLGFNWLRPADLWKTEEK